MRTRFSTLTIVCTLIASSLLASSVQANVPDRILKSPKAQDTFIRQKIREHIGNDPLMAIIAGCESTGNPKLIRHWNTDGTLVKNPGSSASGAARHRTHKPFLAVKMNPQIRCLTPRPAEPAMNNFMLLSDRMWNPEI